jgi:hypothetical protein
LDAVVKILGVAVGTTNSGKQYFDVQCSDGQERRCWNAQLAQKINGFANQHGQGPDVTLRYEVKQNGQWTNYSIKACFGPGEAVVADTGNQGFQQKGGPSGGGGRGGYPPEVTTRITKLASFEYATTLVGALFTGSGPEALEQAYEMTADIAKRIYKAARAHESGGTTTAGAQLLPQPGGNAGQLQPVASDAQGVADFANGVQPGAVQVGAPVAAAQDAAAEAPDTVEWD